MQQAILALADGSIFQGRSVGAEGMQCGELVFNTSMTGYQEILTDPSYYGQIVTLTYPHIGNTGVNQLDIESEKIQAAALVIRDLPKFYSSWRGEQSLDDYLKFHHIVAISDIDTRELTRRIRLSGTQNACVMAGRIDEQQAIQLAQKHPSMVGQALASKVSIKAVQEYTQENLWSAEENKYGRSGAKYHVIAYDFGIKRNILRILADLDCKITILPAETSVDEALALNPDGFFLSNGPGDPEPLLEQIEIINKLIDTGLPIFGICLGHQLLGLVSNAQTVKMKFGHHGANHPVQDLKTKKVMITSQNHGFAIDEATLPANVEATHRSLFDGTSQGIAFKDKPIFAFQGHPEASPGPHDAQMLFERFIDAMSQRQS